MNRNDRVQHYQRLLKGVLLLSGPVFGGIFVLPKFLDIPENATYAVWGIGVCTILGTFRYCSYLLSRLAECTEKEALTPVQDRLLRIVGHRPDTNKLNSTLQAKIANLVEGLERRLNEAELDASKSLLRAEKANGLQERFIRTVSEDIRAPILNIISGIRALSSATTNESELIKLDAIYASSFQLMSSINDALELGSSNAPSQSDYRSVNLNQLTQDLAELFAYPVSKRPNVMVYFLVDHRLPHSIKADPKKIMHLIGNLVENALRFTEKGHIEVILSTNSVSLVKGEFCNITITCSDTGKGITKSRLDTMNRQMSGGLATTEVSELGLGLRAAQKLVAQNGGNLEITSEEGKGTKVVAKFKAEVAVDPRKTSALPSNMRFHTSSNEVFVTLANIAYFHGMRPIPLTNPLTDVDPETIFIDASDLLSGKLGSFGSIKNQGRYVVIFRHDQINQRQKLLAQGFKRFLVLPLSSTAVLQCLLGEDGVVTNKPKLDLSSLNRPLNVLVVDDVETTRLRISEHLRSSNHFVAEASDGLELVELLTKDHNFDIVFCDLTMTHLDGMQAVQQVREYEKSKGKHTSIIAMTAYSFIDEPDSVAKAGFDAILRKPVFLDELDFLIGKVTPPPVEGAPVNTQFIDLDDLRRRTAGKTKIMVQVLDSFIATSKGKLLDLHKIDSKNESVLMAKCLHTIKGLLLEAGAVESAKKLTLYEERIRLSLELGERDVQVIESLVDDVCSEAEELKRQLV